MLWPDQFPQVDHTFVMDIHSKREEDIMFLKKSKDLKFPNYRELKMHKAEMISSDILNRFFTFSAPNSLRYFYLEFEGKIEHLVPSLSNLLSSV